MSQSTFDINNVLSYWGCIAYAEQHVLWTLAELAQTPTQIISFNDVKALFTLHGGHPADVRCRIFFERYQMQVIDSDNPLCGDDDGCIVLSGSPYLGQIWACRLTGECTLGSPVAEPCYYARTAPAT